MPSRRKRSRPRRRRSSRSRSFRRRYRSARKVASERLERARNRSPEGRTLLRTTPLNTSPDPGPPPPLIVPPSSERSGRINRDIQPINRDIQPFVWPVYDVPPFTYRQMSWDIVDVLYKGLIALRINRFLKTIAVDKHVPHLPREKGEIVDAVVRRFTSSQPPNPGVFSMQVSPEIGELFVQRFNKRCDGKCHAHRIIADETTRKTIWETLNRNDKKSILFLYSGDYPQNLFHGITKVSDFPYAGS